MVPSARVRILIDYRPALRQRTGAGEYAHQLAAAVMRKLGRGDELTIFSSSWKDRLASNVLPEARHVDARVPVRVLNLAWHRLEWPSIERFAGPVDIAHSMHPLLLPSRSAAQVVTIHDLYFFDHPERTSAEIRRDYAPLVQNHARRAAFVVVISEYTAGQVERRLGVARDRIVLCPPGAPNWTPRPQPVARGPILFVGTLEPRKNVSALLDAYERLASTRTDVPPLILAGRATDQSERLLERLRQPALQGRARHVGYVTDKERERLYREASILVMPSHDEGFGLPALEAMSIGLPVVAANRGALAELRSGASALVDPDDPEALANAVQALLVEPSQYADAVARGLHLARQFSWDETAGRLLAAYERAVRDRRRGTSA